MWYILRTAAGNEEKPKEMINKFVVHSSIIRRVVSYREKENIHSGIDIYVKKFLFPSYVFLEINRISDYAKRLGWPLKKSRLEALELDRIVLSM